MPESLGKCAVTGGGGFLGSAITRQLLKSGHRVVALGRHDYPELSAAGAECRRADILDRETLVSAFRGCSTVFHTAAICGIVKGCKPYYDVNVRGTANVIQACLEARVSRLVYTSTPSVVVGDENIINGDESLPYPAKYNSPYPATKARAEQMVLSANGWEMTNTEENGVMHLRTCAIRPHLMWGPGEPHIIPEILKLADSGRLRIVGDGTNQVSITHVENGALAHILAARELAGEGRCAGKAYFVNDTEPVVLWDWIGGLLAASGRPGLKKRAVSRRTAWLAGAVNEVLWRIFPWLGAPGITRFTANQLARSHSFSHRKATEDFGYVPVVTPAEGMAGLAASLTR